MKKLFPFIILCVFILSIQRESVIGQQVQKPTQIETTPQRSAEGRTIWLTNLLKLDKQLSKDVYQIFLKYQLDAQAVKKTSTVYIEKKNQYLALSQNMDTQLKAILTRDQYDKYFQALEQIKAKAKANSR
jgi:hypothetical protein